MPSTKVPLVGMLTSDDVGAGGGAGARNDPDPPPPLVEPLARIYNYLNTKRMQIAEQAQ